MRHGVNDILDKDSEPLGILIDRKQLELTIGENYEKL